MQMTSHRRSPWRSLLSLVAPKEVAEFWLSRINRLWSTEIALARVVSRSVAADGAVSLMLQPNRHFAGFRAGQHCNMRVEVDGVRHTRSYSFADAPRPDGRFRVVVREKEGGRVSPFLQNTPVGTVVQLTPAFGTLHIDDSATRPVLLLAAGSGITPMLSLIADQRAKGFPRRMHLMYWARTRDEMIDRDALLALIGPNCSVTLIATAQQGRISAGQLGEFLDGEPDVLACGSSGFVETARALTETECGSFQSEAFTLPLGSSNVAGDEGAPSVNVTLARSGKVLSVPRTQSLLEALESHGLSPAHGCRMGICNTCSCNKISGSAHNLLDGTSHDEASQLVRICVHAAQSDITLDL